MNTALMFSKASDEWSTPLDFYEPIRREFDLVVDAAAMRHNALSLDYFGPDNPRNPDALTADWHQFGSLSRVWCNPPYSKCREFIGKAAQERHRGVLTVALVPARTDTRWFHDYLYDATTHTTRPGIELRFVRGRLKFGGAPAGAPFPSLVVVFRP